MVIVEELPDLLDAEPVVLRHVHRADERGPDRLLLTAHQLLQEVDGYVVERRQVQAHVCREEI